eukprot:PhM_4_TR13362/c2_g1_i1/m.81883
MHRVGTALRPSEVDEGELAQDVVSGGADEYNEDGMGATALVVGTRRALGSNGAADLHDAHQLFYVGDAVLRQPADLYCLATVLKSAEGLAVVEEVEQLDTVDLVEGRRDEHTLVQAGEHVAAGEVVKTRVLAGAQHCMGFAAPRLAVREARGVPTVEHRVDKGRGGAGVDLVVAALLREDLIEAERVVAGVLGQVNLCLGLGDVEARVVVGAHYVVALLLGHQGALADGDGDARARRTHVAAAGGTGGRREVGRRAVHRAVQRTHDVGGGGGLARRCCCHRGALRNRRRGNGGDKLIVDVLFVALAAVVAAVRLGGRCALGRLALHSNELIVVRGVVQGTLEVLHEAEKVLTVDRGPDADFVVVAHAEPGEALHVQAAADNLRVHVREGELTHGRFKALDTHVF